LASHHQRESPDNYSKNASNPQRCHKPIWGMRVKSIFAFSSGECGLR
jgi:hypothetical protein